MNLNMEGLQNKILPVATKISNNKYLSSITDGLSSVLPEFLWVPFVLCSTIYHGIPIKKFLTPSESNLIYPLPLTLQQI